VKSPEPLWKITRLRQRPGKYFNSRPIEDWLECGTVLAPDEDTAAARARKIVGVIAVAIRVEPVGEFYKPETLQD
jgi:hypothetical protein